MDVFDGALVRNACENIYGRSISPDAWGRWKQWTGIKGQARRYTAVEFCLMVGVATLRSQNQYGELNQKDIKAIAYSDATIQMVDALKAHVANEGWALGWDIRSALAVKGYEVSGAMLRKMMPSMRPNQWYQVDAVIGKIQDSTIQDYGMAA